MISKPNSTIKTEPTNERPWNEKIALARQGDRDALAWCCREAGPIIQRLTHVPYFIARLGKDEIQSIASLALLEYVTGTAAVPPDGEAPRMLARILRCEILDAIRGRERQDSFETPEASLTGSGADEDMGLAECIAADSREEPDARTLRQELRCEVREALGKLTPNEQKVIRLLYFQQASTEEAARKMQCTPRNVRWIRKSALARLRKLLEARCVNV